MIPASDTAPATRRLSVTVSGRRDAPTVGVLAFVVGFLGAGRPSLWIDEAATVSASTRPLAQLGTLVQHIDAVHGLYYLLMHGWMSIAPAGEAWARLPSAVMVGAAAAGVVVLGRQLSDRSVGIAAGVVFAVLPRTTWAAVEARPYALTMACSVWLTVLFVLAVRRRRPRLWMTYSLALFISAVINVFVLLVLAAHAVALAGMAPSRRTVTHWGLATATAVTAVLPLLITVMRQQAQVGWIWPISIVTLGQIFGEQYFPSVYSDSLRAVGPDQLGMTSEQLWVAMHAWARVAPQIVVVVVVVALAVWMRRRSVGMVGNGPRPLVYGCAAWVLVPTTALVGYSLVGVPVYQPHYLTFTTAAAALLIGLCVVTVGRDARRIGTVLIVIVLAAVPNYLAQRSEFAKYGSDYSQVADLFAARAAPGDCLHVDDAVAASVPAAIEAARMEHDDGMREVGLEESAAQHGSLFDDRVTIQARVDELRSCSVLWTVTDADREVPTHERGAALAPGRRLGDRTAYSVPAALGFRLVERWQLNQTQVIRSVRQSQNSP